MTYLTHAQIQAAKNSDIDAVASVIHETESLIAGRAQRFSTTNGHTDTDLREDLTQAGRIAVWEALKTFKGTDPAHLISHLDRSLTTAMEDERREHVRPGVSVHTAKRFERAISLAGGDPYEAERIATTDAMHATHQLTPELAHAARLSWMGIDSLDRPFNSEITGEHISLGDVIAREMEMPTELVEPRDVAGHRRTVIRDQVHKTLGALSDRQRHVLKAGFGISPVPQYRPGVDDDELADDMNATPYQVQQARTKGAVRFRTLYSAGALTW